MPSYRVASCPDGYLPFTYLLLFKPTGQVYYGAKYSSIKDQAHPDKLWRSYFSSSGVVKALMKEHGPDSFLFEVRQVFNTAQEAKDWETRVLKRFNAKKDPRFLNRTNGDKKSFIVGPMDQVHIERMKGVRGKQKAPRAPYTEEQKAARSKPRGPMSPEQKQQMLERRQQTVLKNGSIIGGPKGTGSRAPHSEERKEKLRGPRGPQKNPRRLRV